MMGEVAEVMLLLLPSTRHLAIQGDTLCGSVGVSPPPPLSCPFPVAGGVSTDGTGEAVAGKRAAAAAATSGRVAVPPTLPASPQTRLLNVAEINLNSKDAKWLKVKEEDWVSTNEKKSSIHISVRAKVTEKGMSIVLMRFHNIKSMKF